MHLQNAGGGLRQKNRKKKCEMLGNVIPSHFLTEIRRLLALHKPA